MLINDVADDKPLTATRTGGVPEAIEIPEALRNSYLGRYQTETVILEVLYEDGKLILAQSADQKIPLRALTTTRFAVEGTPMFVEFEPQGGKTDSFMLHRGARQLHGKRIPE